MDNDQKFWITSWGIVALVIITFIAACTITMLYDDKLVQELILAGKDPIEAKCAISGFGGGGTTPMICSIAKGVSK